MKNQSPFSVCVFREVVLYFKECAGAKRVIEEFPFTLCQSKFPMCTVYHIKWLEKWIENLRFMFWNSSGLFLELFVPVCEQVIMASSEVLLCCRIIRLEFQQ